MDVRLDFVISLWEAGHKYLAICMVRYYVWEYRGLGRISDLIANPKWVGLAIGELGHMIVVMKDGCIAAAEADMKNVVRQLRRKHESIR